jgi:5'(3')-deoxyribonucleotidase
MRKPDFLIDVDGVLADFLKKFLDHANKVTGMSVKPDEIKQWEILSAFPKDRHAEILVEAGRPGFCHELEPIPGSVNGIKNLREVGNVYALTSPWSSVTWVHERNQWLESFYGINRRDIMHVPSEHKFRIRGDLLLDDKLETVVQWAETNPRGRGLLWDATYNRTSPGQEAWYTRVYNWDAVQQAALHLTRS